MQLDARMLGRDLGAARVMLGDLPVACFHLGEGTAMPHDAVLAGAGAVEVQTAARQGAVDVREIRTHRDAAIIPALPGRRMPRIVMEQAGIERGAAPAERGRQDRQEVRPVVADPLKLPEIALRHHMKAADGPDADRRWLARLGRAGRTLPGGEAKARRRLMEARGKRARERGLAVITDIVADLAGRAIGPAQLLRGHVHADAPQIGGRRLARLGKEQAVKVMKRQVEAGGDLGDVEVLSDPLLHQPHSKRDTLIHALKPSSRQMRCVEAGSGSHDACQVN